MTDAQNNARSQSTEIAYANGLTTSFAYDDRRGWVTVIDNRDGAGATVYSKSYTRNARGQITATDSSWATQRSVYGYDALDWQVSADNLGDDSMDQTWSYDLAGNITYNSALSSYSYPAPTAARPHAPLRSAAKPPPTTAPAT